MCVKFLFEDLNSGSYFPTLQEFCTCRVTIILMMRHNSVQLF